MLQIGSEIGSYRVKRFIGRGGLGVVYLAENIHQSQEPRQVVIKVIKSRVTPYLSNRTWNEFLNLARAIASPKHLHILCLHDAGEQDIDGAKYRYVVMDYCEKGSLEGWYRNTSIRSTETIAHFMKQAADALQFAHDKGIIHEDIKLSNFLLRSSKDSNLPDLLLSDFGVAKLMNIPNAASLNVRGTSAYMAPEQWQGKSEPASDQYSLAVVAYELLTGQLPFQNHHEQEKNQPLFPSTIDTAIPLAVDVVLLKALSKKPEDRYPSITAFADDFQNAVPPVGATTLPAPVNFQATPGTPIPPPRRPLPLLVLIGLAIFVVLSSTSLFAYSQIREYYKATATATHIAILTANAQANATATVAAQATATAVANATANANATVVAQANATATVVAQATATANANATATAVAKATATFVANPYPPSTGALALFDPLSDNSQGHMWDMVTDNSTNSSCQFTRGLYHAIENNGMYHRPCYAASHFSNFVYQVEMTILNGDCGGLIFRADSAKDNGYIFEVCQDQKYRWGIISGGTFTRLTIFQTNAMIKGGYKQTNVIAVVVKGNMIQMYVNKVLLSTLNDNTNAQGQIGLLADAAPHQTDVAYANAKVWQL